MIKGFTPQLAEGGKIKIGGLGEARKSKNGNEFRMPVKHDHFLVTETERDPATSNFRVRESVMEQLKKDDDGQVREIPIFVHSDEIEEVFPTAYALYSGRRMQCRGDGEEAMRKNDAGVAVKVACPCDRLVKRECKPHGTLHCSIRVPGQGLAGAVYKVRTTSEITIRRIIGSLIQIRQTVGVLRGLPLVLCLKPVDVNPGGVASKVYVLHIELREENLIEVQRQAIESAKMRASVMRAYDIDYKQLIQGPGLDEDDDEQDHLNQEYSPETVNPGEVSVVTVESLTQKVREAGSAGAQSVREKLGMGNAAPPKQLEQPKPVASNQVAALPVSDRVKSAFAWLGAKGLKEKVVLGNIGRESLADVTDDDFAILRIAVKAIQGGGKPELALISACWASRGVRDDELAQILGRITIDEIDDHDREALIRAAKYDDPKRFLLGVVGAEEKEAG
jgi:hypothetical protein